MNKILILMTNRDHLDTGEKNGTFALELTHALHEFVEAGYDYELASIKGGAVPIYGEDFDPEDEVNNTWLKDDKLQHEIKNSRLIQDVKFEDYAAIYYPGSFGLLWDLAIDETVGKRTGRFLEDGGVVGAVCHGPAGFLPVTYSDGSLMLDGLTVTGFTREEEIDYGTIDKIHFLLEEALNRKAKRFEKVQPWGENVITQGKIVSGQNPQSAGGVGRAMVKALS